MDFLTYVSIAIVALILVCLLRSRRRPAGSSALLAKDEPSDAVRNEARRRIVADADRLSALDEELDRIAEGTDPGLSDDHARARAEQLRAEAARLRATLEAACARYKLPIRLALGRRRRSPPLPSARRHAP